MRIKELTVFRHVKWSPAQAELRRFAIAMLVGFTVLASLSVWRNHKVNTTSMVLLGIGVVLALSAMIPGLNKFAYLAVYVPSSIIGYVVSSVVLFFVFVFLFVPLGVILKLLGKDLLRLRPTAPRAVWTPIDSTKDLNRYYRQF